MARGRGGTIWRDDTTGAVLSALVIVGLYLDGWSHLNRQGGRLGSFFTPWHGLLYAAVGANAAWVVTRNRHLWRKDLEPHPALYPMFGVKVRYPFALVGLACTTGGMLTDIAWHTLFGSEADVARVIAPTHILLFLGAMLLINAPLRSAWHAPGEYPADSSFVRLLPATLSLLLLSAAASFLLQWLSPFMDWRGARPTLEAASMGSREGLQSGMAARIVMAHVVLAAPVMFAARRWRLPFGVATLVFTTVALAMSALTSFRLVDTVLAALVGGLAVDTIVNLRQWRPANAVYAIGVTAALVTWPVYFLVLKLSYDASWPADFALGTASLCALISTTLAFFLNMEDPRVT